MTKIRALHGFSRRQFLRGAGGVLLAVPFLPSLAPRKVRAAAGAPPTRFVFLGCQFGRAMDRWYPSVDANLEANGARYIPLSDINDADGNISPIFGPAWNNLRDKFSLLRGMDGMEHGDAHHTPMPLTGSASNNGVPGYGYSIDVVMQESNAFYPVMPMAPAIRTCPSPEKRFLKFSYSSANGFAASQEVDTDPYDVYARLFRPSEIERREQRAAAQRPVLNAVMEDYHALINSGKLSREDDYKLEAHLSLMSDIERRLGVSSPVCSVDEPASGYKENADVLHDTAMDIEIAALSCGLTKIVTHVVIQTNSNPNLADEAAHSAAHDGRASDGSQYQWEMNRWQMAVVARFIEKLAATPDGDGTSLLDNTVFYHSNCEARGTHTFFDMPALVAGKPDKLRPGYFIDYRQHGEPSLSNGLIPGRPYNEVLVTLLQAVGLGENDYQRFGSKGFGVYDGHKPDLRNRYKTFLNARDTPLPFLYQG